MNFIGGRHYGFDYANKDPVENKNPDLYKINRLHKSLTENNYLTHAIMLSQHKDLTPEQKEYHEKRMKELFESDLTLSQNGYRRILNDEVEKNDIIK
jgi:hypothetical protein